MKDQTKLIKNFAFFLSTLLILTTLETSLWMQVFGTFPSPSFWIPVLVYWSIYRSHKQGLFMAYLMAFIISPLTALPLGMFLLTNLVLFEIAFFVRSRFYQPGVIYFTLVCGLITFSLPIVLLLLSWLIENKPLKDLQVFALFMKPLLTMLVCIPLSYLFMYFDDKTDIALPTETGRQF
ncbi:MAG: hypothetical protein MK008_10085 [Bdellovibrionales bacterium]|nr:hypothetical protein [Bdellovibrionales bacterium]